MNQDQMQNTEVKFGSFFWRISSSHMVSYFIMGVIASEVLNYKAAFETPPLAYLMKPMDSAWVFAGPLLQIIRGLVFSMALWFFKDSFIHKAYGWLKLWELLIGLSVLSTTGPASGSIEGMIYTKIPIGDQVIGYIEVVPQTMMFSLAVFYWYERPKKLWNVLSIILVSIICFLSTMALLIRP